MSHQGPKTLPKIFPPIETAGLAVKNLTKPAKILASGIQTLLPDVVVQDPPPKEVGVPRHLLAAAGVPALDTGTRHLGVLTDQMFLQAAEFEESEVQS